jgi:hypothetical protein
MSGTVDRSQVLLQTTYRVGILPPNLCSLTPGELFIEVVPSGGGAPRIWIGTAKLTGYSGNVALISPVLTPTPSVITPQAIANPSPSAAVRVRATVAPGCVVEMAALAGSDINFFTHVSPWSAWDATSAPVDVTWYLPRGDHYRVRFRMRDTPQVYVDSNLFAVV